MKFLMKIVQAVNKKFSYKDEYFFKYANRLKTLTCHCTSIESALVGAPLTLCGAADGAERKMGEILVYKSSDLSL